MTLADKFDGIEEKQRELEQRIVKVLVAVAGSEMSQSEKNAAKEIRETNRQLAHLEKSVVRVKALAKEIEAPKVRFLFVCEPVCITVYRCQKRHRLVAIL